MANFGGGTNTGISPLNDKKSSSGGGSGIRSDGGRNKNLNSF